MRTPSLVLLLLGVSATASAAAGGEPGLIGTQWRLVAFESSDAGAIRPAAEESYTLRLDADGLVAMQLSCNRGMGRWNRAGGGRRGRLEIDDLSMTRAACPESPLERITEDMSRVRTYQIEGGRLHLGLRADGGTYVWEAAP